MAEIVNLPDRQPPPPASEDEGKWLRHDLPMSKSDRAIGHRLRLLRLVLNLTEEQVAKAARVTLPTYRKWERFGYSCRSALPLVGVSRTYKVSLDWLFVGDAAGIGPHLAQRAPGSIAILPVIGSQRRAQALLSATPDTPPPCA